MKNATSRPSTPVLTRMAGPAPAPTREDDDRDAGHEHRQRREHERGAEDGADADRLRALGRRAAQQHRPEDGDDRDERLGHGRRDGRQHAADGPLGQLQLVAEPLDAVGEELGGHEDDRERADEQDDVHDDPNLQIARAARASAMVGRRSLPTAAMVGRRHRASCSRRPVDGTCQGYSPSGPAYCRRRRHERQLGAPRIAATARLAASSATTTRVVTSCRRSPLAAKARAA